MRVPTGRVLGVPAAVLAQDVPELGIVQQRPYLGVVGALEVVARLPALPRLQQDLEVLLRVARYPRVIERRTQSVLPLRGVAQIKYESPGSTIYRP